MAEPEYSQKSVFEIHGGNWNTIGGSAATRGGDEEARVSYRAGASWEHSDGYRDNSGFDLWRANGGVRKDFEIGSRLKISSFYSDSQYELPGALTYEEWKHDARMSDPDYSYYDCRQTAYGMNLSGNTASDGENVFKFATSLSHRRDRYASCNRTVEYVQDSPFDLYSLVFTPQYVNMSGIGDFENEFTLGGSVRWDVRKGFNQYDYPAYQWKQKEDQSRWTYGGFARDEFFIYEDVSVFAGARLERMMTRSESLGHPSRNDNLSAHEAGVNWRMAEDAKLFAKWARFYRAPFVDEVAFASGRIVSPERGWSFDVGGDWEMIENFTAGGSLYLSETENEIYYDPFLFDNCNLPGSVRRTGGDFRLKWEMEKKAAVTFRYGFVNPEIVDGSYRHEQMPAVPRHRAAVDGRIFLIGGFSVRGGCRYVGEQYSISDFRNEYGKMKGYVLFSLGFRYEAESDRLKGLAVDIDVDNLFDRDYCDYATYGANFYPGAGRSFMVKVTYEF
jgi:outer membrane receptor protein involved in Fe transport